jgi:hypothetical protein
LLHLHLLLSAVVAVAVLLLPHTPLTAAHS